MHFSALTAPEQRVLGCLIEKRFTTPDGYPLSLNALRNAANQITNRDPVVNYDEATLNEAAQRLSRYGLARLASGHSSRAVKYRHLAEEALGVDQQQLALLCVLLLRGPQTPGELKARTERMASFSSLEELEAVLATLADRGLTANRGRRPGQKEDRWAQLLGGDDGAPEAPGLPPVALAEMGGLSPVAAAGQRDSSAAGDDLVRALEVRVATLEAEVAELRALLL